MRAQALAHQVISDHSAVETLETFLMSDRSSPDSMTLSALDGFLTGIAIGPELIRLSEWLPLIWGDAAPGFADLDEANAILGSLMARYNEILRDIADDALAPSSGPMATAQSLPWTGLRAFFRQSCCAQKRGSLYSDPNAMASFYFLSCCYAATRTATRCSACPSRQRMAWLRRRRS
jgi:hypothetical protein